MCPTRMRSIQDTATRAINRYDILYAGDKRDAGVGRGRRRQFLNRYGFRFSTALRNVFVIEMRDSVVFSVVQTAVAFERFG
jgi:hypothetical protein